MTYVAIGASETLGFGADDPVRQAWTQVFYRTALPRAALFVNLGVPGATVAEAIQRELPEAEAARPDVVTVWLNVNDLLRRVPPAVFGNEFGTLLSALRRSGVARLLVANTPSLDDLPRFVNCRPFAPSPGGGCNRAWTLSRQDLDRLVQAYNETIARVASVEGVTVVDLNALTVAAEKEGTESQLVSSDGFHPSTAGHLAVARAFDEAWRSVARP